MSVLELRKLRANRPRDRFLRVSLTCMPLMVVIAWFAVEFDLGLLVDRWANLSAFTKDFYPYELSQTEHTGLDVVRWAGQLFNTKGLEATRTTLCISIIAMALVVAVALPLSLVAARSLAVPSPYLEIQAKRSRIIQVVWLTLRGVSRVSFVIGRAIPEYIWAFLLVMLVGPGAWPAILALAIHNAGVYGKLSAEFFENTDPRPAAALRSLGASRLQIAINYLLPTQSPKLIAFFFYRWETCVREAVVLGMLGIASVGYWIIDARSRRLYDEMLFFILLGTAITVAMEILSAIVRRYARTS